MVREQFNEENMNIADPHARTYVAGLIRHTVVENPDERWTATELLRGIDWCLDKFSEHAAIGRDGFSCGRRRLRTQRRVRWRRRQRSATADHDVAEAFVVGDAVALDRIDLALRLVHGSLGRAEVVLVEDVDGSPSEQVVERWDTEVREHGAVEVVRLHSQGGIRLGPGATYWVTLSARDADSEIGWVSGAFELRPRRARFAERDRPQEWRAGESPSGPAQSLRVLARRA